MATTVTPINIQKMEYDVTTGEGASRVTIVTGTMAGINLIAQSSGPGFAQQQGSFKAVVDPALTPGQFRKATALASVIGTIHTTDPSLASTLVQWQWRIDEVEATLDDESGQIALRVDLNVSVQGAGTAQIDRVGFQVTTLAKL